MFHLTLVVVSASRSVANSLPSRMTCDQPWSATCVGLGLSRARARVVDQERGSAFRSGRIKHRRAYDKDAPPRPDWRITCIYVDKRHRGQGVARAALEGALDLIARAGGGLVEAISDVTTGRKAHGHFLFSGTVELFEEYGFTRLRQVGKHAWIVSKEIDPAGAPAAR
jgi:GNAT superfamily N-acetyltransferase